MVAVNGEFDLRRRSLDPGQHGKVIKTMRKHMTVPCGNDWITMQDGRWVTILYSFIVLASQRVVNRIGIYMCVRCIVDGHRVINLYADQPPITAKAARQAMIAENQPNPWMNAMREALSQ
jgi:hypothetical protein